MKKIPKHIISALIISLVVIVLVIYLGFVFSSQKEAEPIYPGPGVTDIKMLSYWYPELKDTSGDTEVYILDSGVKVVTMSV